MALRTTPSVVREVVRGAMAVEVVGEALISNESVREKKNDAKEEEEIKKKGRGRK